LKPAVSDRRKLPWLRITTKLPGRGNLEGTSRFRVNRDLMRVLGYFLAEGHYYSGGKKPGRDCAVAEFSFGKSAKEKRLAEDCARRIRRIGGTASVRLTKFGWHVNTYGPLARLLLRECGTGAENKKIPAWAYTIGDNLAVELLLGYMLGDGYK